MNQHVEDCISRALDRIEGLVIDAAIEKDVKLELELDESDVRDILRELVEEANNA